jgi:glycosyltransferase involved in cell wall biosynthesis
MGGRAEDQAITYAVVGHNEAELLANAIGQAAEAARPGDSLWFVNGASTDGSEAIAARLGAEVVNAPLGKGRALATALARCETPYICFLDGDIEYSSANIPISLREALFDEPADMIVADFEWPNRRFNVSMTGIYWPLSRALFPEADFGRIPYSGFRLLRADLPVGALPAGFGVESYLNTLAIARGWRARTIDVGEYRGPVRRKPDLGWESAEAILDVAEAHGRLDPELRPRWDEWVAETMRVVAAQPDPSKDPPEEYRERLSAAAGRPFPPAKLA